MRSSRSGWSPRLLDGRKISPNTQLWVHTPRALREVAERNGYVKMITRRGRRGDERHLPGDLALRTQGHPRDRDRLGQAGALSAGYPRPSGLVRHASRTVSKQPSPAAGTEACNEHRQRHAHSASAPQDRSAWPQGRRRLRRGRGAGDARHHLGLGRHQRARRHRDRAPARAARRSASRTRCWCFRAPKVRPAGPPTST